MALTDVTGVFSRYFVVGFFLPAYIALVSLWLTASSRFIPNSLESHSQATQLLILGGVALVVALALSGLSTSIAGLFRGLWRPRSMYWVGARLEIRRYDHLSRVRDGHTSNGARASATRELDRHFPYRRERLLGTRLGNIFEAFWGRSEYRWGIDGRLFWDRAEGFLTDGERELLLTAKTDLFMFINAALGALVVGIVLIVDGLVNGDQPFWHWLLYLLPFLIGYVLYRAAWRPALNWGDSVEAGIVWVPKTRVTEPAS